MNLPQEMIQHQHQRKFTIVEGQPSTSCTTIVSDQKGNNLLDVAQQQQQQNNTTIQLQNEDKEYGGPFLPCSTTSTTIINSQQQQTQDDNNNGNSSRSQAATVCAVCGEENVKMHYGVLACLGCKGFFRRALKKATEYECLRNNNCMIDKFERNSCRACRLQKCLDVGMDPNFVRPNRDIVRNPQQLCRQISFSKRKSSTSARQKNGGHDAEKSWTQRLSVEMRTMLMALQNIEAKVVHGDTEKEASEIYPLRINTIREIIEEPTKLCGSRTEMRYEPYRMAKNEELCVIVYRRLIAAIDWVNLLADRIGGIPTEDRIALVKACFGPLTLFKCSARTAGATENEDMLCLCNFAYVPRNISKAYHDAYHLDNGLVERLLNELVSPFRQIHLKEEEIVCLSAIIVANPMAKDLTEQASDRIFHFRNRVYATLYQTIKECRPECNPNSTFGNLLLFLPLITFLANSMIGNLQFAQTFSTLGGIPLLTSMFGCFPVEPFLESELTLNETSSGVYLTDITDRDDETNVKPTDACDGKKSTKLSKQMDACTQTDWTSPSEHTIQTKTTRKRRLCPMASTQDESNEFRLLKAPCSYLLTEMFDDRINELEDEQGGAPLHGRIISSDSEQPQYQQNYLSIKMGHTQQESQLNHQPAQTLFATPETTTSSYPYVETEQIQRLYLNDVTASHFLKVPHIQYYTPSNSQNSQFAWTSVINTSNYQFQTPEKGPVMQHHTTTQFAQEQIANFPRDQHLTTPAIITSSLNEMSFNGQKITNAQYNFSNQINTNSTLIHYPNCAYHPNSAYHSS